MAHSQHSEEIYLIRYPDKPTGERIESSDFEDDEIMNPYDKEAARQGKFNLINSNIAAEFTVPIKPWCKHDYGQNNKRAVSSLFKKLKLLEKKGEKLKPGLKVISNMRIQKEKEGMWNKVGDHDFVIVNDTIDKGHPRILFRSPTSKKSEKSIKKFWETLENALGAGRDDNKVWKSIVDDISRKSEENKVIAHLNFELVKPEAIKQDKDQQTTPRENGFDREITRDVLKIIREEVEYEITNGMFDHYNSLRLLLYHSMINLLMGEPHHAANELGKWRKVQCNNMFCNFPPLKDILNGYQEFLKKESHMGASEPLVLSDEECNKATKKTKKDYTRLINLLDNGGDSNNTPDMCNNGQGGIGFLHDKSKNPDELIAIQRIFIPTLQLHLMLEDIKKIHEDIKKVQEDSSEHLLCKTYFKKACNIGFQIKQDIEIFLKEKNGDTWLDNHKKLDKEQKQHDLFIALGNAFGDRRYDTIVAHVQRVMNWLEKHESIDDLDNPNTIDPLSSNTACNNFKISSIAQTLQREYHEYYLKVNEDEAKDKRIKYMMSHLMHMRFLIGIAQFYHIMRDRKLSPQVTFSEFEVLDGKKREFIFRFIEICSLLILSESTKREHVKNKRKKVKILHTGKPLTIPLTLAYLYRAKAFLYLGENQRAYNDFNKLERLVETTKPENLRMDIAGYPKPCIWFSKEKAKSFADWLKVCLNYQKGRVYFASFAQAQSLVSFCRSIEKLYDFDEKYQSVPRITTINSMIYKGKGFFERGSFSRSLKWYFKAVIMIMQYMERWWSEENERIWFDEKSGSEEIWSPLQYALIKKVIDLLEVFKHNAFIKKEELALMLILPVYKNDEKKGYTSRKEILKQAKISDSLKNLVDDPDADPVRFKKEIKSEMYLRKFFSEYNENKKGPIIEPEEIEQILDIWRESVYSERFKELCDSVREQYRSNRTDENKKFPEEDECLVRSINDEINSVQRVSECLFPKMKIKGSIKNDLLIKASLDESDLTKLHENRLIRKIDNKGSLRCVYFDHKIKEKGELKKSLNYLDKRLKQSKIDKKKIALVKKIWEQEIGKRPRCFDPMARILSDVLNRIGFILFDLRLHPEQRNETTVGIGKLKEELTIKGGTENEEKVVDLALDWVEKAFDINPKNGFARFNQLLIKDAHNLGNENQSGDFVQAFENEAHFHRKFYPVILHWMKQWRDGKGCVSKKSFKDNKINLGLLEREGIIKKDAKRPSNVYFCETITDRENLEYRLEGINQLKNKKPKRKAILKIWDKSQDQKDDKLTSQEQLYSKLLRAQLMYIGDLIKKPAEIYDYLTKRRTIPRAEDGVDSKDPSNGLYFLGRYSSWSPKQPRPRVFSVNGGGKFIVWKGKGVLIDPGFDLLNNLYAEGFSLEDIDAVIVTHDHHDHTDDFESMWRLIKEHNEVVKPRSKEDESDNSRRKIIELTLFTNLGFEQRCSRFLSSSPKKTYVKRIYPLCKETVIRPDDFAFDIHVVEAKHKENLTDDYSIGFVLKLFEDKDPNIRKDMEPVFEIGFPSDTCFHDKLTPFYDCDIVIPHISNATFRELKVELGFTKFDTSQSQNKYHDGLFDKIKYPDGSARDMISVLKWSFWYGRDEDWIDQWIAHENDRGQVFRDDFGGNDSLFELLIHEEILEYNGTKDKDCAFFHKLIDGKKQLKNRLGKIKKLSDEKRNLVMRFWFQSHCEFPGVTKSHLGARGVFSIWNNMISRKDNNGNGEKTDKNKEKPHQDGREKLLVLSEFREEMGSSRNKVAVLLNEEFRKIKGGHYKKEPDVEGNLHCLTSDIGMAIHFTTSETPEERKSTVQCSVCRHDNDLYRPTNDPKLTASYPDATFHSPDNIKEVCIKGDSEGMVYLCKEHDTGPDSLFIEHMDHFNLFGHEGISL